VLYEDRASGSSSHLLAVGFKEGIVAINGRRCKTTDVLTAEICINNSLFVKVGDGKRTWLSGEFKDGIIVNHFFNPGHGSADWGWEESIRLRVECVPMSEDIVDDAVELIEK